MTSRARRMGEAGGVAWVGLQKQPFRKVHTKGPPKGGFKSDTWSIVLFFSRVRQLVKSLIERRHAKNCFINSLATGAKSWLTGLIFSVYFDRPPWRSDPSGRKENRPVRPARARSRGSPYQNTWRHVQPCLRTIRGTIGTPGPLDTVRQMIDRVSA